MKIRNLFSWRYWYWRFRLRGKMKLNIDLDKSQPIDTQVNREQKRLLAEFLAQSQGGSE